MVETSCWTPGLLFDSVPYALFVPKEEFVCLWSSAFHNVQDVVKVSIRQGGNFPISGYWPSCSSDHATVGDHCVGSENWEDFIPDNRGVAYNPDEVFRKWDISFDAKGAIGVPL